MDVAEAFGADIDLEGPDPGEQGTFLVQRRPDVDHDVFMRELLRLLGDPNRLLLHNPSGIAVIHTTFAHALGMKNNTMVKHVGGVNLNPDSPLLNGH